MARLGVLSSSPFKFRRPVASFPCDRVPSYCGLGRVSQAYALRFASSDTSHLFADSAQVEAYAAYRPTYPALLYDTIEKFAGPAAKRRLAVDVATGSGQAAIPLAERYDRVIGLDNSKHQLKQAPPRPNIEFRYGSAENLGLDDSCADLITAAQALHWFDRTKFYQDCYQVLVPGGVLACWGYALPEFESRRLNDIRDAHHHGTLGPYWDSRRELVESHYKDMEPTNFDQVERATVPLNAPKMTVGGYMGLLRSQSAFVAFQKADAEAAAAALDRVLRDLLEALGPGSSQETPMPCVYPIFVILARRKP